MTTTLLHPDSPNPIEVEADRVALYAASGWVVVKAVKVAPKRRRRPAPKKSTPVPPTGGTVANTERQ